MAIGADSDDDRELTPMASPAEWLIPLARAHAAPWEVADGARAAGGRAVGVFGRYAPRELVAAAGMLPVRLRPGRIVRTDGVADPDQDPARHVPEGLRGELSGDCLELLSALLGGELDWLDALLIGRDSESHTKLFYVVRELAADPEYGQRIPPFAFSDLLRLPLRTSADYNRTRLRQLRELIGSWGSGEISDADLRAAIDAEVVIAEQLRVLNLSRSEGRVRGSEALVAAAAAACLSQADARDLLAVALRSAGEGEPPAAGEGEPPAARPRVFVTGSEPALEIYEVLESAGLALVGDDHWDDRLPPVDAAIGPIDWLADRYQFSDLGAARAGLGRVQSTARRVQEVRPDAVLQLILPGDEASAWELSELRALLPDVQVLAADLSGDAGPDAVRHAAAGVLDDLGRSAGQSREAAGNA